MKAKYINQLAVPMFTVGLLSLVLGVFAMTQSTPAQATTGTKSITLRYMAYVNPDDSGIVPCGTANGAPAYADWSKQIPLATAATTADSFRGGSRIFVYQCVVKIKVPK
jgi:hypothetical protein